MNGKLTITVAYLLAFALVGYALLPLLHDYYFSGFGYSGPKGCIVPPGLDTHVRVASAVWGLVTTGVLGLCVLAVSDRDEFLKWVGRRRPTAGAAQ